MSNFFKMGHLPTVSITFICFIFASKKELGGGTVLDVGVYTIQFCQFIFQKEPKSIKATGRLNDQGVDLEMSAELRYDDGKVAKMKTTALYTPSNTAKIYGTKGSMTVMKFMISSYFRMKKVVVCFALGANFELSNDNP